MRVHSTRGAAVPTLQGTRATSQAPRADTAPHTLGVDIGELSQRYGWKPGSWQERLLQAADGAGTKDGKVSAAEVEQYLAQPGDLRFLTSSRMVELKSQVAAAGGQREVDAFEPGWQSEAAHQADLGGNGDGRVTAKEMDAWMKQIRDGKAKDSTLWLPDQKHAAFNSKLAELTGEVDHLNPGGASGGTALAKEYMRLALNEDTRVASWASYQLSAADLELQGQLRRANFRTDKAQPGAPVADSEYEELNRARARPDNSAPFDRGHLKEAEASPDKEAMAESFLLSNAAPQYDNVNSGAWRYLEDGVRELVSASGGKATVFTGTLYLDKQGRPLPPEQVDRQATGEGRSLAVPTHLYKSLLLERPDGKLETYAFVVPNDPTLGRKVGEVAERMGQERWRVSVDELEQLTGQDFFSQLPAELQERLESDSTTRASGLDPKEHRMATLFMGG